MSLKAVSDGENAKMVYPTFRRGSDLLLRFICADHAARINEVHFTSRFHQNPLILLHCLWTSDFSSLLSFSLFLNKKYLLYGIAAVIFTLLGAGILLAADYWWIDPIYYQMDEDTLLDHYVSHLVLCIISTAAILSILLVRTYSQEVQKRNEAQLMLSEIQIKYLHAQLNPHFFLICSITSMGLA
ncbi:hypothetical protein QNH98_00685 [Myroides sp. mNGS23_01]|nr:hypothetical protein [Myroides sp. mNGS23_01]WHT39273.1 hypothetical protein QNH98_00685 [Myroides sp. mNGS23_01]